MTLRSSTAVKLISVITPCFNAEKYIAETVRSVINNSVFQDGRAFLEYIICDGGSTDKTCEIVKEIIHETPLRNIKLTLCSEQDRGMYEALSKGLRKVSGDFCAYLNAGDFYSPTAIEIVLDIFCRTDVKWLTGLQVRYNEQSHLLSANLPFKFRRPLCQCGRYGGTLPFIQQESTFWDTSLNSLVDLDRLSQFRYAGDFFLWKSFASREQLYIVEAWLGGFKVHQNQLSDNLEAYRSEMNSVADPCTAGNYLLSLVDKIIWHSPNRIKRFFNRDTLYSFDFKKLQYELNVSNF